MDRYDTRAAARRQNAVARGGEATRSCEGGLELGHCVQVLLAPLEARPEGRPLRHVRIAAPQGPERVSERASTKVVTEGSLEPTAELGFVATEVAPGCAIGLLLDGP